jgi:recombination protein RecA
MAEEAKSLKDLDKLIGSMQKKYGQTTVFSPKKKDTISLQVERWPVESPCISFILGGGTPKGRIIELFGPESGGKSSLATYLAGEAQKAGANVAVIDAEYSFDFEYAKTLGLDTSNIIYSQPEYGEQANEMILDLVNGGIDIIIIDSVAALTPKAEIEGDTEDQFMGLHARLMSKICRKTAALLGTKKSTVIFINQIREKIGAYGNPQTTTGGHALKFFSSVRLEIRRTDWITGGKDNYIGLVTKVKGVKNKTAPPMRIGKTSILFGKGFQYDMEYVDFALHYGLIQQKGAWYYLDSETKFQGKDKLLAGLQLDESTFNALKNSVYALLTGGEDEKEDNERGNEEVRTRKKVEVDEEKKKKV